jgi:hypothetical protein
MKLFLILQIVCFFFLSTSVAIILGGITFLVYFKPNGIVTAWLLISIFIFVLISLKHAVNLAVSLDYLRYLLTTTENK